MSDVWIIMGNTRTKKSATIRALTGAFKKGYYDIATNSGVIRMYVQISALQESKITPKNFISSHRNDKHILLSLWIDQYKYKNKIYPNGGDYINEFIRNGWNIREIVVLGTNSLPYTLPNKAPNLFYIPNSIKLPANEIAHEIRQRWGWL